jgi:hypothetical protein
LDEKTGKIVPAKIKGLLDMGVKPIYKLTTEDGRTIRTTGNHPYLVANPEKEAVASHGVNKKSAQSANSSEFSNSAWISDLSTYFQYSRIKEFVKSFFTMNNLIPYLKLLKHSSDPADRMFFARIIKTIIEIFRPFPEVKKEIEILEELLKNYYIF